MASTGLLSPAALGFHVRRRDQPSVSVSICRVAVLGGFPTSANFEAKLAVRALNMVGKQRNAQTIVYLPITYVPGEGGGPVARRKHLDCNICSLRIWLWAAHLHAGHAYSIMGRMSCLYSRTAFLTERSLGRLCIAAFCCTRATWKAVHSGLLLHQGHLEGCAERPFVAPGPLGRLCRAAFC